MYTQVPSRVLGSYATTFSSVLNTDLVCKMENIRLDYRLFTFCLDLHHSYLVQRIEILSNTIASSINDATLLVLVEKRISYSDIGTIYIAIVKMLHVGKAWNFVSTENTYKTLALEKKYVTLFEVKWLFTYDNIIKTYVIQELLTHEFIFGFGVVSKSLVSYLLFVEFVRLLPLSVLLCRNLSIFNFPFVFHDSF